MTEDNDHEVLTIPATQAKLQPFSEPTETFTAEQFIQLSEDIKASLKWTDNQHVGACMTALKGKAQRWADWKRKRWPGSMKTFTQFKQAFLERFKASQGVGEIVKIYSGLKQGREESVSDFFERCDTAYMAITQDFLPSAKETRAAAQAMITHFVILAFINGLHSRTKQFVEAQFSLKPTQPTGEDDDGSGTILELLDIARKAEISTTEGKPVTSISAEEEVAAFQFQRQGQQGNQNAGQPGRGRGRYTPRSGAAANRARGRGGGGRGNNANPGATRSTGQGNRIWCLRCRRYGNHIAKDCRVEMAFVAGIDEQNDQSRGHSEPAGGN